MLLFEGPRKRALDGGNSLDSRLLRAFQRQVTDQCRLVLFSVSLINTAAPVANHEQLWIGCQMFVTGSGNLSKALWGQKERFASEREPLRESLEVTDASPLRIVTMRNNFEHYDERLDLWWATSPNHSRVDQIIGAPSNIFGASHIPAIDRFRVYDPVAKSIIFWGESFDLEPIAAEVVRIFPIAETEADKPYWET